MLYATMRIGNNCEYFLFQSLLNLLDIPLDMPIIKRLYLETIIYILNVYIVNFFKPKELCKKINSLLFYLVLL